MRTIRITSVNRIKLNSFRPLCWTELGERAIATYHYPPFIDASCRREPDFENPFPSISALCRQGQFAPHLEKNDVVVYITVAGKYPPHKERHHRLVAILRVVEIYGTHQHGEIAYRQDNIPVPSNCMVSHNLPFNFDQTAGDFDKKRELSTFLSRTNEQQMSIGKRRLKLWDQKYLDKTFTWACFIRTEPLYVNVSNPDPVFRSDFEVIFSKIPNTRTPVKISKEHLAKLGHLCNLDIEFV
jgi:hypothetical protein